MNERKPDDDQPTWIFYYFPIRVDFFKALKALFTFM